MATTLTQVQISVSASEIAAFDDCEARHYHAAQRHPDVLETDQLAADVSSAVHDTLMEIHRHVEQCVTAGRDPQDATTAQRTEAVLAKALARKRLTRMDPEVSARLARLEPGLERATKMIAVEAAAWPRDRATGDLLIWQEAWLDHGPSVRAVQLADGFLVRTKPDVIALRRDSAGVHSVLIRDYKGRREPVDPAFDTAILVRAMWALMEVEDPRCRWFVAGRNLQVDASEIRLETLNLMFPTTDKFLMAASVDRATLLAHRDRLIDTMVRMDDVAQAVSADQVLASPGYLCLDYCPFLNRCEAGMSHVRKYHGGEVLTGRLAGTSRAKA